MPAFQQPHRRHAFTLIELMVSIFLMLLIMIGVNSVFTATSATIGTSAAISATNRDARAIQTVLNRDFGTIASDAPAINIRCEQRWMHPNSSEFKIDPTPNNPESADLTNSGTEATLKAVFYNSRSHRTDRISYFTRQLLRRQTGNDGTFIANQAALEQWVWLGHLRLPDNTANPVDANFRNPGELNGANVDPAYNPNNLFAQQWALGRMAMQLVEPTAPAVGTVPGTIKDSGAVSQNFIYRSTAATDTTMSPLDTGSTSTTIGAPAPATFLVQESRYDLAGTSIAGYSQILSAFINRIPANASSWWVNMLGGPTSRFRGMPYPSRPLTAQAASQVSPVLAMNCSQFIVEFAGDFLNQDAAGVVTDTCMRYDSVASAYVQGTTDGLVDFVIPAVGAPNAGQRQIRWYGMPRSTSGSTSVKMTNGDVVPLRDVWQTSTWNTPVAQNQSTRLAPFERTGGSGGNNILTAAAAADYTAAMAGTSGYYYPVAWGPTDSFRPKLIRITMTLEDPNNRLTDGQTYEYVFAVGN